MKTIYKYPINITSAQEIDMPSGAEVISAGLDPRGVPCVWALVDDKNATQPVTVHVLGTGHPVSDEARRHVSSFKQGPFVWHVFVG